MFIRETKTLNRKTGKVYVKHTLVESVRTPKGPRQRTVMSLGTLSLPRKCWESLAAEIECRLAGQSEFPVKGVERSAAVVEVADGIMADFKPKAGLKAESVDREGHADYIKMDANTVTTTDSRTVGAEIIVHDAWTKLGLGFLLQSLGFTENERSVAEAVVTARLIAPDSDLGTWEWIRSSSAIGELTERELSEVGRNRVYEIADRLYGFKKEIETHLSGKLQELFPGERQLFLFDLTNFYLEGQAAGNTLAHRGKSKEKRTDCPLVSLALAVDSRGFPLFSRVYPGNIGEPKTLEEVLTDAGIISAAPDLGLFKPTVVMDRGIATKENLKLLADHRIPYIAIERGPRTQAHLADFLNAETDPSFHRIERENGLSVLVKKVAGESENSVEVLCLSLGKREKELAMTRRWEERAAEDLLRLQKSVRDGNLKQRDKILKKVGRLEERYPGLAKRFQIDIVAAHDSPAAASDLTITKKARFDPNPEVRDPLLGCYVIETPHTELSATEIWSLYMTLTRVEDAFRTMKTELGTRPVYHQLAERTCGHLFISVIAYGILASIEHRLATAGDHRSWRTIRDIMATHTRNTIVFTDDQKQIHHLRQTGRPESAHLEIYRKLKITCRMPRIQKIIGKRL